MPYINKKYRSDFDYHLENLPKFKNKGELEYCVFKLMMMHKDQNDYRYSDLHDCTYAVMHCADEFRRRFLDDREEKARIDNGDIK